jgi:hypothetical protein
MVEAKVRESKEAWESAKKIVIGDLIKARVSEKDFMILGEVGRFLVLGVSELSLWGQMQNLFCSPATLLALRRFYWGWVFDIMNL